MVDEFKIDTVNLNNKCPVCGSENGEVLGSLEYTLFDDSLISNNFNVVCCIKCGFIFYNTSSSQNNYDNFYKESFYSSSYNNLNFNESVVKNSLNILLQYIINKNISIFDIGCGVGLLLKSLHKLGYKNLYGVDPSISCVSLLNNEGVKSKVGSVLNIPFNDIKADIIILSHVTEHIISLKESIRNISNKLSENGLLYIEVPDASRYNEFDNISPIRFFYLTHLIHFDKYHLHNLFVSNGYEEVDSGYNTRVEGDLSMPCIWGIYRKTNKQRNIIQNFNLSDKIKTWFSNISLDNNNIFTNLALSNKPTYIWGIGIHTQMMLSMSPLKNCNIKCFVDSDERNCKKTINKKPIYSVNILSKATKKDVIVISAPTYTKEMYKYLTEKINFNGKIIAVGFGNVYVIEKVFK